MCQTQAVIVADMLHEHGGISGLDAIYTLTCTTCGKVNRVTRLAAVIWDLRNLYGWDISTNREPGMLAEYKVVKEGRRPGAEVPGVPSPLRGVRPPTVDDVPTPEVLYCSHCGAEAKPVERLLGGWAMVQCPKWSLSKVVGTPKQCPIEDMTLHPREKADPKKGKDK
jgi:hypothetical protein